MTTTTAPALDTARYTAIRYAVMYWRTLDQSARHTHADDMYTPECDKFRAQVATEWRETGKQARLTIDSDTERTARRSADPATVDALHRAEARARAMATNAASSVLETLEREPDRALEKAHLVIRTTVRQLNAGH